MHEFPLISTIAASFTAAWLLGMLTHRLGLSPIVGYLLAGVLVGPHTPGFVGDVHLASQLAEIGVILLMFGVGLHFHFKDLLAVRAIAIPGAIGQSIVATLFGAGMFALFGWPFSAGLIIGVAMAVASTVVLMRVLMDAGQLDTPQGHAAVGWLIVEDVITVVVLVLIPALGAGDATTGWLKPLGLALGKLLVLIALLSVAGTRLVPWILVQVARLRSRELFTLTILVLAISVAAGSAAFFGASMALGAFLAGMLVGQSPVSQQAGADALPMRDAFAVLFFVSVGMLFDPRFLIEHPVMLIGGLVIVLVVKPAAALTIVALLGYPIRTGLTVAIGLAQIGEFSFILSELARKHDLVPLVGHNLLVACALVSITINPLIFRYLNRIEVQLRRFPWLWSLLSGRSERKVGETNAISARQVAASDRSLAIVVGYGPTGRHLDRLLREADMQTVVIDLNMDAVAEVTAQKRAAIYGDAAQATILEQAGVGRASHLVLTTADSSQHASLTTLARDLNPTVRILARTRYMREVQEVQELGPQNTVVDEVEAAVALSRLVLSEIGATDGRLRDEPEKIRRAMSAEIEQADKHPAS